MTGFIFKKGAASMDPMFRAEQERLDRVIAAIDGHIARLERETGELREEVVDIRRRFWEDVTVNTRSEEHTSELQSRENLVCRLLLEKKKKKKHTVRDSRECD